jgi:hypothetical protein
MAPSVVGSPTGTADTSGDSFTAALPAGVTAGELLLLFMAHDLTSNISQSSGPTFTRIDDGETGLGLQIAGGNIWARIASGGEANPVFSSSVGAEDVAVVALRVSGHGVSDVTTDITVGTPATGASTSPDPGNCNPGVAQDYLWIAYFIADDDDNAATWWPTNYTAALQQESANSTSSCMVGVAYRQLNASSEDTGAFTMSASEDWRAVTIAIPPAAAPARDPGRLSLLGVGG